MIYSMIIILQLRMCNVNEIKNEETFFSINKIHIHILSRKKSENFRFFSEKSKIIKNLKMIL